MNLSARRSAILALSFVATWLAGPQVSAQEATPPERCEGTLCDLYYGGPAPGPQPGAKTPAPKPVVMPSGGILGFFSGGAAAQQTGAPGAPAKRPLVGVGGGGLAATMRGDAPERCSGTLCDFYYGGPAPEKTAPQDVRAPTIDQQAAVEPASDSDLPPAQPRVRYRQPREEPGCAPKPNDPWSCYRK